MSADVFNTEVNGGGMEEIKRIIPEDHPEHLLPSFNMRHVLAAMCTYSSDELAHVMAEAAILFGEAVTAGIRRPSQDLKHSVHILKQLYRAFDRSTTDMELLDRRMSRQFETKTGAFDSDNEPEG